MREQILSAALALIDTEGIDAVTIRSVGEAANVGRTTVSHHFTDKNGLLDAIHLAGVELFARAHAETASVRPESMFDLFELDGVERSPDSVTGQEVVRALRARHPGLWELLLLRRCPDFSAEECPTAVALLDQNFRGGLSSHRGRTFDLIWKHAATEWEWKQRIPGVEYDRITSAQLDLPYYTGLFGLDV